MGDSAGVLLCVIVNDVRAVAARTAASVLICTPHAVAEGGAALGTIATEAALREVVTAGGLSRFRRATETPFNRVFKARR
jgi:hypothetical protein